MASSVEKRTCFHPYLPFQWKLKGRVERREVKSGDWVHNDVAMILRRKAMGVMENHARQLKRLQKVPMPSFHVGSCILCEEMTLCYGVGPGGVGQKCRRHVSVSPNLPTSPPILSRCCTRS